MYIPSFFPKFSCYMEEKEDHDETKIHGKEELFFFLLATNPQARVLIQRAIIEWLRKIEHLRFHFVYSRNHESAVGEAVKVA